MSQCFSNNINCWNTTINYNVADTRSDILTWLSPLDPKSRHQEIRDHRVEEVGEWLLQTKEFRSWYASSEGGGSDNPVLFFYGDPGVGKTYMSSLLIDSLCAQVEGQNVIVACFYFDFTIQKEQSPTSSLGALLKQLVGGLEKIPEDISQACQYAKKQIDGRKPELCDIVRWLQNASSKERTFICIDALDECVEGYRVRLLDSLNKILQKSPGTRIFVTGRPHIRPEIGRRLGGKVTSVSISPKRDDIIRYLRTKLSEDPNPDAMDSSLEADILEKIPDNISEIFLLVSMNIDTILQETTIHRRRQRLSEITKGAGLGGAYGATLGRIKGQGGEKSRLGMAALMWISHSERPLKVDELCHALAVEIGSPNLHADNVPAIGTLLSSCQGLVVVDKEASIVRLIHFTLQEYLRAQPELFSAAHSTMAETCLSYLNSQQVKALSTSPSHDLQDLPFLEYSSLYWGVHAKKDLSDCAKSLALKLFDDYNNHISTTILLKVQKPFFDAFHKPLRFSSLHCGSLFGIVEIVAGLVEVEGCDINEEDCTSTTPLVWAADNGHEGVVEILLGREDVKPNKSDRYRRTPLNCAAENGHEGVVKMLLERDDVNPNKPDDHNRTPLYCAAENGHEGVVGMLLERDNVNLNQPDEDGQAPLGCAARNGHDGVVEILLGHSDISPHTPNPYGQTPLHCAVENGQEGAARILLGWGNVNPDEPNDEGQTLLYSAAENGHEGIVKILLGRGDVSPEKPNQYGESPLCCAAWHGHEGVVKLLLRRDDVDPGKPDEAGRTPLCSAAENGKEGVVKILLGREDVDPNKPDEHGQAPLGCAAWNGHEEVVKILLGRSDINPDQPGKDGRTPLSWAAENGHAGVVALLRPPESAAPSTA